MKTRLLLCFLLFTFSFLLCPAQTPQGFNYQAIARDGSGNPIVGAIIKVKLSILTDTTGFRATGGGVYLWEEEHLNVTTNAFGLFNIVLGDPLAIKTDGSAASFSVINWSLTNLYLGTKIANPTTYKVLGAAKLWSVPYALRAKETDQWLTSGANIYRQTGNVGIGTNNPLALFHVAGNTRLGNSMVGDGFELQTYASGNRYSGIDFHGDDTYTDYGLRILRYNTGPNAGSSITHRGLGELNLATQEAAPINFYTTNLLRMTIRADGNVGVGTASPTAKLEVRGTTRGVTTNGTLAHSGQFQAMTDNSAQGLKAVYSFYPTFESTPTDNVGRRAADIVGGYNGGAWGKEYLSFNVGYNNLANDAGNLTSEKMRITSGGLVGIGTSNPTSKMVVQPPTDWADDVPLFEVKNKWGTPVLAVYNNGVRILVAHDAAKGVTKGGFAIGGFDNTKAFGETVNLMTVAPDSIRFNIDNDNVKGITKGGFAIGGFDVSKGINVNPKAFMNLTPFGSPDGQYNTFLGYGSGKYNTTGIKNAFIGYNAGLYNRTGNQNVIVGTGQLWTGLPGLTPTDMGSYNTFVGYYAGGYCKGIENTAVGNSAGVSLTNLSNYNSFFGRLSGNKFNNGIGNVFLGNEAGLHQTSGDNNTYVGAVAGWDNVTGSNNIFLGTDAGSNILGSNNIVIGINNGTTVPAISGSNTLLIGPIVTGIPFICGKMSAYMLGVGRVPTAVTFEVGGDASKATAGAWLANSDFRIKKNIEDIDNALELIQQLHPVKFSYSDEWLRRNPVIKDRVYYNFIAQEYKEVFPESVQGSGEYLKGQPDEILQIDSYNSQVIAVKAIQELIRQNKDQQIQIESTKEENQMLKSQLQLLQEKMDRIEAMLMKGGVK